MLDADILGPALAEMIRDEVEKASAPLRLEIADLRKALGEQPQPQELDTAAFLASMEAAAKVAAEGAVAAAVQALPAPKDGEDGKDIDPDAVDLMVAQAIARIPAPKDGISVTLEDVAPLISEAVEKAVGAIPPAKDGVGLAGAVIDRSGSLVVTLTDGSTRELGQVVGRDGIDAKGEPGRDALTLSNFDTDLSEDGRFLIVSLENDDMKITHELQLPIMIYRGVFKEGCVYLPGDTVTWAGSLWHCDAETSDKPGEGAKTWTLAAKKGRDGKDAPK